MHRVLAAAFLFSMSLVHVPAAVAAPNLKLDIAVDAPAPLPVLQGAVAVTFADGRSEEGGGGDPRSFGVLKSSGDRRILHKDKVRVGPFFVDLVTAALRGAGHDVVDAAPDQPRVLVTLLNTTASGLTHMEMLVEARLELFGPGGESAVWEHHWETRDAVVSDVGPEDLVGAYSEALTAGVRQLVVLFDAPEFRAGLGGGPAVGPETGASSVPATPPVPPVPPVPGVPAGGMTVDRITDATEQEASARLSELCLSHFEVAFAFLGEDDSSEWTLTFVDEDDDPVGYVNLDDEDTVEFDGDDEDLDEEADAGEVHQAVIRVEEDELTLHIDGHEVLDDEDLDGYDECLHLRVIVDDDMSLTDLVVTPLAR